MSAAGTWNLEIATPMGTQQAVLELIESAGGWSGVARSNDDTVELKELTVDGQHLSWKQDVTKPFKVTVTFDLDVEGDTLSGKAKPGMFPASKVVGTRA